MIIYSQDIPFSMKFLQLELVKKTEEGLNTAQNMFPVLKYVTCKIFPKLRIGGRLCLFFLFFLGRAKDHNIFMVSGHASCGILEAAV